MARQSNNRPVLRYDSKGRPLKDKKTGKHIRNFFLGFLIPYLVINGAILFLVLTRPSIVASEPDTTDYQNASISFSVDSFLPMRSVTATLEGEEIELTKSGDNYSAVLQSNGNLIVNVESMNRMTDTEYISINILDETAPTIDEDSIITGAGFVEFNVSDSQSGMNYESIYAIDSDGDTLSPLDIDQSQGKITFSMKAEGITIYVSDMAGNEQTLNLSIS